MKKHLAVMCIIFAASLFFCVKGGSQPPAVLVVGMQLGWITALIGMAMLKYWK